MKGIQTAALFVDQYRELSAKKLFWITLALSGLVVVLFAALGINEEGMSIFGRTLGFTTEFGLTTAVIDAELFYKGLFSNLGIGIWLTWIATILALVSTAGIIPDLVAGGSIETVLSRPIGRVRLFLTKYISGLLFVALQVGAFSVGSFLVFGLRAGLWEPRLLLAIPIVLVFFSYLFSVCVLIGLLTRSTIFALLATLLFWGALVAVNIGDGVILQIETAADVRLERATERVERLEAEAARQIAAARGGDASDDPAAYSEEELDAALAALLAPARPRVEAARVQVQEMKQWRLGIDLLKLPLPKTRETIGLLERSLIDLSELPEVAEAGAIELDEQQSDVPREVVARRVMERSRERPVWRIIGTSLVFEAAVLGLACWIFTRRDF